MAGNDPSSRPGPPPSSRARQERTARPHRLPLRLRLRLTGEPGRERPGRRCGPGCWAGGGHGGVSGGACDPDGGGERRRGAGLGCDGGRAAARLVSADWAGWADSGAGRYGEDAGRAAAGTPGDDRSRQVRGICSRPRWRGCTTRRWRCCAARPPTPSSTTSSAAWPARTACPRHWSGSTRPRPTWRCPMRSAPELRRARAVRRRGVAWTWGS